MINVELTSPDGRSTRHELTEAEYATYTTEWQRRNAVLDNPHQAQLAAIAQIMEDRNHA